MSMKTTHIRRRPQEFDVVEVTKQNADEVIAWLVRAGFDVKTSLARRFGRDRIHSFDVTDKDHGYLVEPGCIVGISDTGTVKVWRSRPDLDRNHEVVDL